MKTIVKSIKNIGQKSSYIFFLVLTLSAFLATPIFTYAKIDNQIVNIDINTDDILFREFSYTNTEKEPIKYTVEVQSYDAKEEKFLNTKPFITLQQSEIEIKSKQSKTVKYIVSIPSETPVGTYFNVISVTPKTEKKTTETNIGVTNALGILVVINVTNSDTSIAKIYQQQSETQLTVENPGFPFIYPMQISYSYINKSNYVFAPMGEIRVLDNNQTQVSDRYELNNSEKKIYPNEKIEVKWEIDTWKSITEILNGKTIVARIYSGEEDIYIADQINVKILEQVSILIAITLLITILMFSGIFSILKKIYSSKRKVKEVVIKDKTKEDIKLSE